MSTLAKTSGRVRLCVHYDEEMRVYDLQCPPMSKEEFEIAARGAARAYARSFTQSMFVIARAGKARRGDAATDETMKPRSYDRFIVS